MFQKIERAVSQLFAPVRRWIYWIITVQNRERKQLLEEVTQMREFMPLLMKHRNGYHWTKEERKEIRRQLKRIGGLSPYLVPVLLPGGFLLLPLLAWWLDRRRQKRAAQGEHPARR